MSGPRPGSRRFRTYHEVDDPGSAEVLEQVLAQRARLGRRLAAIRHVVAVASGKGGVGKSAVTANLAAALASRGHAVGALDADLNGPSLARMLGVAGARLEDAPEGVRPPRGAGGVPVMSMELLQGGEDVPLRWRGPGGDDFLWQSSMETGALREFLSDVEWGELDYLLVDVPPGVDKIRRLLSLVPGLSAALLVTTPSEMARAVVARSARLLRESSVPLVALVANMTFMECECCGHRTPLFAGPVPGDDAPGEQDAPADGARRLARETGLEAWAEVPFEPALAWHGDRGEPWVLERPAAPAARALAGLALRLEEELP